MSASNIAQSVRDRLLNRARRAGEDFQALLTRYALERLMYRLSQSAHRERFVLKGAYAFLLWEGDLHRPTQDLDLLGFQSPAPDAVAAAFQDICRVEVSDDGVRFDSESVAATSIRAQAVYNGVRLTLTAAVGTARLPLQIDVGFGDAVVPAPVESAFPTLLDFPAAHDARLLARVGRGGKAARHGAVRHRHKPNERLLRHLVSGSAIRV
jgi:hypothetical protein